MPEDPYYQIKRKFHQTFYKNLYPYLQSQESKRAKIFNIIATIGIIAAVLIFKYKSVDFFKSVGFLFLSICIAAFVYPIIEKKFEYKIKQKIMPQICGCFDDLTWSQGNENVDEKIFYDSGLTDSRKTGFFEDVFSGCHKNFWFQIIETCLADFSGVVIEIGMNKIFKSHTIIRPDPPFFGTHYLFCTPRPKLKRTELEDVVFGKKYDVYTNDEVEARYLITTSFMERLNNIEKIFKASSARCSFYNGILLIGLSTPKDIFCAAKLNKSLKNTGEISTMFDEIISIYKLIDYLKLKEKIGL